MIKLIRKYKSKIYNAYLTTLMILLVLSMLYSFCMIIIDINKLVKIGNEVIKEEALQKENKNNVGR